MHEQLAPKTHVCASASNHSSKQREFSTIGPVAYVQNSASPCGLQARTRTIHRRRKYLLQRSTSGVRVREQAAHFSRIRSSIRRQSPPVRPRNVRFVLCAIAERTHGAPAAILRLHRYDYVSIDAEVTESKNAHTMHARRLASPRLETIEGPQDYRGGETAEETNVIGILSSDQGTLDRS
ncbi:hypothetical protein WH47_03018 [Habropoda laboriosa]|uniref:Uncharacterized protein n=1 Tax=Habropoda laboriosa TaxID=597456 RepID=A0A0L7QTF5_9HYME|nr:hypothetical protein WH47_03018 [Habropoda laboriosa]